MDTMSCKPGPAAQLRLMLTKPSDLRPPTWPWMFSAVRLALTAAWVVQQAACGSSAAWLCPQASLRVQGLQRYGRDQGGSGWRWDAGFSLRWRPRLPPSLGGLSSVHGQWSHEQWSHVQGSAGRENRRVPLAWLRSVFAATRSRQTRSEQAVPRRGALKRLPMEELAQMAQRVFGQGPLSVRLQPWGGALLRGVCGGMLAALFAGAWGGASVLAQGLHPGRGLPTDPLRDAPSVAIDQLSAQEWASAWGRYDHEPEVTAVVRAAVAHQSGAGGIDMSMAGVDGRASLADLIRRSRWRGLVPRVSASVRHGQAYDLVDTQVVAGSGSRYRVGSDRDLALQLELSFDLPSLVASADERALIRQQFNVVQAEQALSARVVRTYFERRRLQILRDLMLLGDVDTQIRITELQALLDSFTGGAFSSMIQTAHR